MDEYNLVLYLCRLTLCVFYYYDLCSLINGLNCICYLYAFFILSLLGEYLISNLDIVATLGIYLFYGLRVFSLRPYRGVGDRWYCIEVAVDLTTRRWMPLAYVVRVMLWWWLLLVGLWRMATWCVMMIAYVGWLRSTHSLRHHYSI